MKSLTREFGFFMQSSCDIGTKYIFFVLSNFPILTAEAPKPSLVAMDKSTGRCILRWLFTAMVTGVSVIPFAIFPKVLPVQGATTSTSQIFLGPMGSASSIVLIIFLLVIFSTSAMNDSAVPNLVSLVLALVDIIGIMSYPSSTSFLSYAIDLLKVQKEADRAYPTASFFTRHPP